MAEGRRRYRPPEPSPQPYLLLYAVKEFSMTKLLARSLFPITLLAAIQWTALPQQTPLTTVRGLKVAEGLELTLWAAEPDLVNPTNIDIDARGRVWVLEAVNYRRKLKNQPDYQDKGDRIVILEDTNGDGKADKRVVFDQSTDLRAPLGISVFGNKVIVSQSPNMIVYTKDDNDKIISKEVLLTGFGGIDHDHGLHVALFGPDGRVYYNHGDQGFDVTDKSGRKVVSSKQGPNYAGSVIRMNLDGTDSTVIAHNFRNPYELALDSYGTIWQTDNDDDGNAWTRLNYVMEGGNFGYWGPGGRSWRADKGSHFHSELPGVVPNIARTGPGSPCGLIVYEGKLLPKSYQGQLMHAEAGKRYINTFRIKADGAGYKTEIENTVTGTDTWFRPSDLAVSPDGAVFISDWYDPGVGGHNMVDIKRGRIYRLAPKGYKTNLPKLDTDTPAGLKAALGSPAQSVRYLAYTKIRSQGQAALPMLKAAWRDPDPVLRARALWLLGALGGEAEAEIRQALESDDANFRILALRILRQYDKNNFLERTKKLQTDNVPAVRREVALSLREVDTGTAIAPLLRLIEQYDGKDRWYLEALGIAARGKENELFAKLQAQYPGDWNARLGELIWEFRPSAALPYLMQAVNNSTLTSEQRNQAQFALTHYASVDAAKTTAKLAVNPSTPAAVAEQSLSRLAKQLFSEWIEFRKDPDVVAAIKHGLTTPALGAAALDLADDLEDAEYAPQLLQLAQAPKAEEANRVRALTALGRTRDPKYQPQVEAFFKDPLIPMRVAAVRAYANMQPEGLNQRMRTMILSSERNEVRSEALRVLARDDAGAGIVIALEEKQQLPAELRNLAINVINQNRNPAIRARAAKVLPPMATKGQTVLSPPRGLLFKEGDAARGKRIFSLKGGPECHNCHSLVEGKQLAGPNLSGIGTKYGKEGLLDSILNPSAAIAPEYTMWIFETKTQGLVTGTIGEDTPQRVIVRTETGEQIRLRPSDITSRRQSKLSMMPEDLINRLTEPQLVDLLEYLLTLKKL